MRGRRIVVAEDVAFLRGQFRRILTDEGAEVHVAADGAEALAVLGRLGGADALLCDLDMPGVNGLELIRAVRTGQAGVPERGLFVVVVTGHTERRYLDRCLQLEVGGFLRKPVSAADLVKRLARLEQPRPGPKPPHVYGVVEVEMLADAPPTAAHAPPPQTAAGTPAPRPLLRPASLRGFTAWTLDTVPEGAELAEDLRLGNGELLVSAGTTLSATLIRALQDLAELGEPLATVWIRSR